MARDQNIAAMTGRLGADVELKQFGESWLYEFRIAVNDSVKRDGEWKDEADWWRCKLWRKTDKLAQYMTKGKQVSVWGRMKAEQYEKGGEKKTAYFMRCDDVQLGQKSEGQSSSAPASSKGAEDDIPFTPCFDA